jgi:hypothetical protein
LLPDFETPVSSIARDGAAKLTANTTASNAATMRFLKCVLFINLPSFFILVCPQAGHAAASTPMVFYIYYHKHPVYAIKNTHTEMPCSSKYRPETCLIFSIIYKFWKYSIVTAETPAPAGKGLPS